MNDSTKNSPVTTAEEEGRRTLTLSFYNEALDEAYFELGSKGEAITAAIEDIRNSNYADYFDILVKTDYMAILDLNETLPPDDYDEALAFYSETLAQAYEESGSKDSAIEEATADLLNSKFRFTFQHIAKNDSELIYAIDDTFPDDIYE